MQPKERAEEVRVCAAGYAQVYGGLASDGDSGRGCHGSAVVMERIAVRVKPTADRFSRLVGVLAGGNGIQLVQVALQSQVGPFAAHVRYRDDGMARPLVALFRVDRLPAGG